MEARRQFLGFDQPAVQAASELLVRRYLRDGRAELSLVIVVVPGGRAGRKVREHLVRCCSVQGIGLLPPEIVTVSRLPELLYRPQRPFAAVPVQQMMWGQALKQLDLSTLRAIIPNAPDARSDTQWSQTDWIEYGSILWRQYQGLAGEGLSFADVCQLGDSLPEFPESRRWQAMAVLQQEYLRQLDAHQLWDKQTARLVAARREECSTDCDVYLLGTTDLGQTLRKMLLQVSERVTALVHAPDDWSPMFDEFGCLLVEPWCEQSIELNDAQWSVAEHPSDLARTLANQIGQLSDDVRIDQVRIGCADERLVPFVRRVMTELGVPCRWGPGRAIEQTGPYQLLKCLHDWLLDNRFMNLVTIARHPQVSSWLTNQEVPVTWLSAVDRLQLESLPSVSDELPEHSRAYVRAKPALEALARLRKPLDGAARPAANWAGPLSDLLSELYSALPKLANDVDNRFAYAVCEKIQAAIESVTTVPDSMSSGMTAAEVIHLVLRQVSGESVPPPQEPEAVELLGWLELPLDDAPHLFIGGFNEGCVPQAVTSDLFLPNRIREHLQIDDDRRRYARDAYALSVLLHSKETVHLVTARRDADNNPLKPSRLLFATSPETVAQRWQRILDSAEEAAVAGLFDVKDNDFGFTVPTAIALDEELKEISVTDFKLFLACPYRYYLARRLKLRPMQRGFEEMNPATFGTLVHSVLGRFGNSEHKHSSDPKQIQGVLNEYLDDEANKLLGQRPLTAVQVQIEQLRQRLGYFSHRQARLIDEGWRIHYAEGTSENEKRAAVTWNVAGRDIKIIGRIDRIDYHQADDRFRVLDYKTFDQKKTPVMTHRPKDQWKDLQLPLYRHLAATHGVEGTIELGYFIISKTQEATDVFVANWDAATLDLADEAARRVISQILNNEFGEPVEPAPQYSEDWDRICLVNVPRALKPIAVISSSAEHLTTLLGSATLGRHTARSPASESFAVQYTRLNACA